MPWLKTQGWVLPGKNTWVLPGKNLGKIPSFAQVKPGKNLGKIPFSRVFPTVLGKIGFSRVKCEPWLLCPRPKGQLQYTVLVLILIIVIALEVLIIVLEDDGAALVPSLVKVCHYLALFHHAHAFLSLK